MHTINSIMKDRCVTRRAVQAWVAKAAAENGKEIGSIDHGQRVFSDSDRDAILSFASPPKHAQPTHSVTVHEGNHRSILSAPIVPDSYDLGAIRSHSIEVLEIADPMALALQYCQAGDQLISAMQLSADGQQQKLDQTRRAVKIMADKSAQIQQEQLAYRILSEVRAGKQNDATADLSDIVGKLNALAATGQLGQ
jgi:hypothetical protein